MQKKNVKQCPPHLLMRFEERLQVGDDDLLHVRATLRLEAGHLKILLLKEEKKLISEISWNFSSRLRVVFHFKHGVIFSVFGSYLTIDFITKVIHRN